MRCRLGGFLRLARPEVIRRRLGRHPSPHQEGVALNQLYLYLLLWIQGTNTRSRNDLKKASKSLGEERAEVLPRGRRATHPARHNAVLSEIGLFVCRAACNRKVALFPVHSHQGCDLYLNSEHLDSKILEQMYARESSHEDDDVRPRRRSVQLW